MTRYVLKLANRAGVLLVLACALCAAVGLGGCGRMRLGRLNERAPQFESPLPPVSETNLSLAQIRDELQQRQSKVRSLRANLNLVAGIKGAGKQQFQVMLFAQLPGQFRVRGSQDVGTIFDILVRNGEAQLAVYPERKYYRGTVEQLRASQNLLAGIYPQDLIDNFVVEQTLLSRIAQFPNPIMYATRDHYIVRFDFAGGLSERFNLRRRDLLTDVYERYVGQQLASRVEYWGYQNYGTGFVLPSQFLVTVGGGGQFAARVTEMRVNEKPAAKTMQMDPPEGFQQISLGR